MGAAQELESSVGGKEGFGYVAVMIVPTGIGASIGGYAGDAMPSARTIASVVDTLVTHPNVMNGAQMYWPECNILYTEGYALDEWAAGRWGLRPLKDNSVCHRIGMVLDRGIDDDLRLRHVQAANAARATLGINMAEYIVTDEPLGVEIAMAPGGSSWGTLRRPDSLLRAAHRLVNEAGCSALALVAQFPDDEDPAMLAAYRAGAGVDAVGGAEAIISHLVTMELGVPCAHAPSLEPLDVDESVSPRACAEELGYTFLPCVLANLHRAPRIVRGLKKGQENDDGRLQQHGTLLASHVDAVVVPLSACGGSAVLSFASRPNVLLVVVEENETLMGATPEVLGLDKAGCQLRRVRSYMEAVGLLAAHRAGILPDALTSQMPPMRRLL